MIDVEYILKENSQRKEELNKPYNPLTGENCNGKRVRIEIKDAPFSVLYLPEEMMQEFVCKQICKHQSIEKTLTANKFEYTEDAYFDFWVSFCELRYKYDFEFFAASCVTIRDKISGSDIPFRLNRGQRLLLSRMEKQRLNGEPIRIQVTKARQWGCSTLIQIYMKWIQIVHKLNWNSVICAHVKDAAITVRSMYSNSIKAMIPIDGIKYTINNYQGTQNIKEVLQRGCRITVGTAIEPESVRSQDVKMVHFSEMAHYPNTENNNPELLETSIVSSIPEEPLTLICRESTANGVGDYFQEQWEKAKNGESAYESVFVPWFLIDIYSKPFDGYYYLYNGKRKKGSLDDFISSLNEYEINLFNNNKECTIENLNWRRAKRATMPSEIKMKQEYPSSDIEAFQGSGSPVFRSEDVDALRKDCKKPVSIGVLTSKRPASMAKLDNKQRKDILADIDFVKDEDAFEAILSGDLRMKSLKERDRLKIWAYPDKEVKIRDRYVVVFDPQKGISEKADWGVITVFDRYPMILGGVPEIAAQWRGRIDKDVAIWIAAQTAKYYNNGLLVVESNTYDSDFKDDDSEFIFDTIADYYNNLYSRTPADKIKSGYPIKYGFNTNKSTKPMIIGNYVAILREKGYKERDADALDEALVYEQKKNGSYGAKHGKHDDILMTRMIGCYICYELDAPVVTDGIPKYEPETPTGEGFI